MAQSDRGATWSRDEVMCLLELWSDDRCQAQLLGTRRNIEIYRQLAADLKKNRGDMAVERSPEQCRSKLKSLIREYHQAKKHNNRSGAGRSKFAYFDIIDGVLQDRPSTSPAFSLDTSAVPEAETEEGSQGSGAEEENPRNVYICIHDLHYVNL